MEVSKGMADEVRAFMGTKAYALLLEEEKEGLRHRLTLLVDYALQSHDIKLVQIAQSIRRECVFLSRLNDLVGGMPQKPKKSENKMPQKEFEDFEVPDFISVGEGTYS